MLRALVVFIISLFATLVSGGIDIKLYYGESTEAVVIRIFEGSYDIWSDGEKVAQLNVDDLIYLSRLKDRVTVTIAGSPGFISDSLTIKATNELSTFAVRKVNQGSKYTEYKGNLGVSSDMNSLIFINRLEMEDYIAAVVQAEGGYRANTEYFKTQAVITRTYAFLHRNKHADEGYDLCDNVHCQVYHGKCDVEAIREAVFSTRGEIITDSDTLLILTPFHSNCGGETAASDQVWLTGKPYLVPVIDPYCAFSRNAVWEKRIGSKEFVNYLTDNGYNGPVEALLAPFTQVQRMGDFEIAEFSIPLTRMRSDLGLRSSLFSFTAVGDTVLIKGRGYGHGVGLCQEGAMVMATRGYTYKQIIDFYFKGVKIMDIGLAKIPDRIVNTF